MKYKIYVPMTRMNFIAAMDAQVIAPSGFYQRRKFYEDSTALFPKHILASDAPMHFAADRWDGMLESEGDSNGDSSCNDDDGSDLNFPVLLEVEVSSPARIKAAKENNGALKFGAWNPSSDIQEPATLLLQYLLPVTRICAVYTPGASAAESLREDPALEQAQYKFSISALDGPLRLPAIIQGLQESKYKIKTPAGIDLDYLDKYFAVTGGLVMMAEALRCQEWQDGHGYAIPVMEAIDAFIRLSALNKKDNSKIKSDELSDLKGFVAEPAPESCISSYTELLLSSVAEGQLDLKDTQQSVEESKDLCLFKLMAESVMLSHPSKHSAMDAVQEGFGAFLKHRDCEDVSDQERFTKGIEYVAQVVGGMEPVARMFSPKTKWARSLRAGTLFVLRPDPAKLLSWPAEKRPGTADLLDYLNAAFLCGLFNGFTRLPVSIKTRWGSVLEIPLARMADGKKKLRSSPSAKWSASEQSIEGSLNISYPGYGELAVETSIAVETLLRSFVDVAFERLGGGDAAEEKRIIGLLANQCGMSDLTCLKIEMLDSQPLDPENKVLTLPKSRFSGMSYVWNYSQVLDRFSEKHCACELPEEIIHLLCHYLKRSSVRLQFDTQEAASEDLIVDHLDSYLRSIYQEVESRGSKDLLPLHTEGVALGHELLDLYKQESVLSVANRRAVRSAFFYLVLENDVISEEHDTDLGMLDDWLFLAQCVKQLKPDKEGRFKEELDSLKKRAGAVNTMTCNLFGPMFVETIIDKVNAAFNVWRLVGR